jgi:hypothetical protein
LGGGAGSRRAAVTHYWPRRTIVMETIKTVLYGAIGIRSCSGAVGAANLNPIHIVTS